MSSILEILTSEVSTSLVIAKVLIFASTSPSLGCCLAVAPLIAFSDGFFWCMFSKTPTVNYPREVMSSAKDY
jgi:hypothetical protein